MGILDRLEREKREALAKAKPCPVCGSRSLILFGPPTNVRCACMDCDTSGPRRLHNAEAVEDWNRLGYEKEGQDGREA